MTIIKLESTGDLRGLVKADIPSRVKVGDRLNLSNGSIATVTYVGEAPEAEVSNPKKPVAQYRQCLPKSKRRW